MDKLVWLRTVCQKNGLMISDDKLTFIQKYVELLLDWNRRINLISRRDEPNIWERHILHSLAALFKLDLSPTASVLDLGAGGGLPGIPIKIVLESLQLTCLDSIKKKTVALGNIVLKLSLSEVQVVCGRAEDLGKKNQFHSSYDYVLCRAVGPLKDLVKWSAPFLRKSGEFASREGHLRTGHRFRVPVGSLIAWKGGELEREFQVVRKMKSVRSITVVPIVFEGSETIEANDKQLVILPLS